MPLAPGARVGPYEIAAPIGAGGMGEVYRALDTRLDRSVALKLLPAHLSARPELRQRLEREARAVSSLNHPNICTLFEVGNQGGEVYLVMEYVEGSTLRELLRAGGLPLEAVLRCGAQIADALAHAHGRGIVHRDLKSANIMVGPEGRVKVLDFGLAKRLPDLAATANTPAASLTASSMVVGTLPYMAPEVLCGGEADARADIWALGAVLYEVLSGELPFRGASSAELTSAIIREAPAPLPEELPAGLRALVYRCLQKEPARRYQRAGEVAAVLEALQAQQGPELGRKKPAPSEDARARRGAPRRIRSLAVLPLENLSGDPEQEYFSDGMTDALIADLAQIGALRVISRTSVMRYKKAHKAVPEIGRELKVDAVVEGTVLRSGERVRITAQLIEAATDHHLWAKSYERELRDVLEVQGEVARAIAGEIQVKLTPREKLRLEKKRPVDPEAHKEYLRARYQWNKRTEEALRSAIRGFEQAIARDPEFALAYAGLADSYVMLGGQAYGVMPPCEAMPKARAAAERALQLDDSLAEARTALAHTRLIYEWDWAGARRDYQAALQLKPGYATAHQWFSIYLTSCGRHAEAIAEAQRALDLDPLSLVIQAGVGMRYYFAREYTQALAHCRRALDVEANFPVALEYAGRILEQVGEFDRAVEHFCRALRAGGAATLNLAGLVRAHALADRRDEAANAMDQLVEISRQRYVPAYHLAIAYLALEQQEETFAALDSCVQNRCGWNIYLNVEPRLDAARSDPRFSELLRRVGLDR